MDNDKLYIEDFSYYLNGRNSGHIKVICPLCHEQRSNKKDKSLSIDCSTLAYKCHYCGASGYLKSRTQESIQRINKEIKHMPKTYRKPSTQPNIQTSLDAGIVAYFKGRGISEQTLLEAKVTKETYYFPQDQAKRGCIAFNYYVDGEYVNTKYRTRDKHFTFIGGAKVVPYNLDSIAENTYSDGEQKYCIITEGEADTLTYIECGYKHVISMPAGANVNLEWMDDYVESHFDKLEVIYVSTDGDKKGIEAKNELIRRFGAEMCKVVEYPDGCKDINEVLVKYGREKVIECFKAVESDIDSTMNNLVSNKVLAKVRPYLEKQGYRVEIGKSTEEKIDVPVLFGRDNIIDKCFYTDALSKDGRIVVEVEAGQATENHRFLKDIFEACMMFEVEYLVLAVRNIYRTHDDFTRIYTFLETLYISGRLQLPLKGILLIGY